MTIVVDVKFPNFEIFHCRVPVGRSLTESELNFGGASEPEHERIRVVSLPTLLSAVEIRRHLPL